MGWEGLCNKAWLSNNISSTILTYTSLKNIAICHLMATRNTSSLICIRISILAHNSLRVVLAITIIQRYDLWLTPSNSPCKLYAWCGRFKANRWNILIKRKSTIAIGFIRCNTGILRTVLASMCEIIVKLLALSRVLVGIDWQNQAYEQKSMAKNHEFLNLNYII